MRTDAYRLRFLLRVLLPAMFLLMAPATAASAQVAAQNFQELGLKVKAGDSIYVTDRNGREFTARILELTVPSLVVSVDGSRRVLSEGDVSTIAQRVSDPLKNGALIGLGVGGGLAALVGIAAGDQCAYNCVPTALIYAGLGAAIGTGIDAATRGRTIIYTARRDGGGPQLSVVPYLSPRSKGVVLRIRF